MNEFLNVITKNYANFSGRARRREFWMFTLINTIILFVLYLPAFIPLMSMSAQAEMGAAPADLSTIPLVAQIFLGLYLLYSLAVFLPTLAVSIRRLHDSGKTGWMYLVALIPLIGSLLLLYFLVQDSEAGSNKWGPNPKNIGNGTTTEAAADRW